VVEKEKIVGYTKEKMVTLDGEYILIVVIGLALIYVGCTEFFSKTSFSTLITALVGILTVYSGLSNMYEYVAVTKTKPEE
jgi:uncharacterized membrane protein HdeD (DUF308 family)